MNIIQDLIFMINQAFEIEKKTARLTEKNSIGRNVQRLMDKFAELGFEVEDPMGEAYSDTRTDCEASIAGESLQNLRITDVIKPIIRQRSGGMNIIVQKAVVVVEGN
jgi:uncharacterized protein (UPF0371 family)